MRRIVIYSTLLMTLIVVGFVAVHEIWVYRRISQQELQSHIDEYKVFIRDLVNIEVEYLAAEQTMFDARTRRGVRQNVSNAAGLAEKIYATYHSKLSDTAIKKMIIEAVTSLTFGSPQMHVFIGSMDGKGISYPGNPEFSGRNLWDLTDMNGNKVVQRELEFLQGHEEGFVRYPATGSLQDSGVPRNKVVYVKKFQPYHWYFGSTAYLEDYYKEFKSEVARKMSADWFRFGGYVFVNAENGEPIVMDGQVYQGSFNFLDGSDPDRMAVFKQERDAANSNFDGGFFSYKWNKIGEKEKVQKISFVRKFEACNWLVGAGFYLDEIWDEIHTQQRHLKQGLIRNMVMIFLILFVVLLMEALIIYRLNRKYMNDVQYFSRFFREGREKYRPIDIDILNFREFKNMGAVANEMILERKKMDQQLLAEQEKAKESDRLKTAFLANMSHEIRTPMNAILGFSSLLEEPEVNAENKRMYVKLVQRNGELLMKLINDIMDISKIESDQLSIVSEDFVLEELLGELLWNYRDHIAGHLDNKLRLEFVNNLPPGFRCRTDKLRLKQVLDNLLGNAIKFTSSGNVLLTVALRGKWIHFHIIDNGIGIAKEDLDKIFNRFIQAKTLSSKTYGGTGLGLAISQKIIHLMGGDIGVKSEPGKGSDFYFYIPV